MIISEHLLLFHCFRLPASRGCGDLAGGDTETRFADRSVLGLGSPGESVSVMLMLTYAMLILAPSTWILLLSRAISALLFDPGVHILRTSFSLLA
jgi:hypothetical protein